jgi:hypothetical protein
MMKRTLKRVQGEPTESEEWMLVLPCFFLFLFGMEQYRSGEDWGNDLMKSAIKHPQAPQGAKKVVPLFWGKELFFADEERRGGVAAIEQPR